MKRFFAGLFSFVVIVVLAVMAIPFFVSSDWIKEKVVAELEARTGMHLALDGDVSLSVFPSLALRARNVGLSNGSADEFARVGEFRFGLSLPALLSKQVAVTALVLDSPVIHLSVDAEGRNNWTATTAPAEAAPDNAAGGTSFSVSVSKFNLSNGTVVWSDARSGAHEEVTGISLQTSIKDLNQPLLLTGAAVARGLPIDFDVNLTSPQSMIAQQSAALKLALSSGSASVKLDGTLTPGGSLLFEGPVSLAAEDLAAVLEPLGVTDLPVNSLAINGALSLSPARVEMTGIDLTSNMAAGTGEFALALDGAKPRIDLRLALNEIDLDQMAGGSGEAAGTAGEEARIDLGPLDALDAGLDLRVKSLKGEALGPTGELKDVHAVVLVENGKLTGVLDPVDVGGGSASARIEASAVQGGASISGKVDASGFDIASLAGLAGQSVPASGVLSASVNFSSVGATSSALIAALDANGDIRLADGSISGLGLAEAFGDPAADQIDNVNLSAGFSGLNEPVHITGTSRFLQQAIDLDVTVDPRKVIGGGAFPLVAAVSTKRLSVSFNGDLAPATGSANGQIELTAPSLAGVLKLMGRPAGNLPEGALRIAGNLSASPAKVELTKAAIALGETAVSGNVGVVMGGRTKITANLSGKSLDLGVLVAGMTGGNVPGEPTAARDMGWSDDPIDLSGLGGFDADIGFKVANLRFGALRTGAVALDMTLDAGKLVVQLPELALYKGSGKGTVTLDASSSPANLSAEFGLSGVNILPLLAATAGTKRIGGTGQISLSIETSGASQKDMVQHLNGKAAFSIGKGALIGIDIPAMLRSVATAILNGFGSDKNAATPFETLSASFNIANGIASNEDLTLKSPVLTITGGGAFDLPAKTMSFKVKPVLNAPGAGALDFEVPVVIEGPWSSPRIYPDIAGILDNPQAAFAKLAQLGGVFSKLGSDPGANLGTILDQLAPGLGKATGGDQGDLAKNLLGALTSDGAGDAGGDPIADVLGGGDALGNLVGAVGKGEDPVNGLLGAVGNGGDPVNGLLGALAGNAKGADNLPKADANGVPLPRAKPGAKSGPVVDPATDPVGAILDGAGVDSQTQDLLGDLLGKPEKPKKPRKPAADPAATGSTDTKPDPTGKKPKKPRKPADPADPVNDLINGILQ